MLAWCYETHAHRILYEQVGRQQPQHVIIIAQLDKKGIMVAVRLVGCTVETHVNLAKRRFVFTTVVKGLLLRSCVLLCSLVFLIEKELEAVSCIFESQSKRCPISLLEREGTHQEGHAWSSARGNTDLCYATSSIHDPHHNTDFMWCD